VCVFVCESLSFSLALSLSLSLSLWVCVCVCVHIQTHTHTFTHLIHETADIARTKFDIGTYFARPTVEQLNHGASCQFAAEIILDER
jgi:hypothetical protein